MSTVHPPQSIALGRPLPPHIFAPPQPLPNVYPTLSVSSPARLTWIDRRTCFLRSQTCTGIDETRHDTGHKYPCSKSPPSYSVTCF